MRHLRDMQPKVITELTDRNFSCRMVKDDDEDIIKALECIYSHYKFDYLHQAIYDIDYFKEILRGGRYVAAVAENKDGQIMGFGALDAHPWFDGLMEMGGLIVNPIARGLGLGDMLDDYRIEAGRTRDIRGLFSTPIMPNPASQKLLSRHGFIPTGMYFHAGGPESLGQSGDGFHPMDCGFSVYIYDKESEHEIYAPEECKTFLGDVLDEVGIKYSFREPQGKPFMNTDVDFNHEVVSKLLEVRLRDLGPDFRERIDELPILGDGEYEGNHIQAIMLLMSMNDPLCPECYSYMREKGFIFTGCVPGGEDDLIVMEHLKHPVYRDFIKIEPDYERILDRLYDINGKDMD